MSAVDTDLHRAEPTRVVLAAAGTLPRAPDTAQPNAARRFRLWLEIAVIFVGLPFVMMHAVYVWRVPVWAALFPVLLALIAFLAFDRTFSLPRELTHPVAARELGAILALALAGAGVMAAAVLYFTPDQFLALPQRRPAAWRKVLTNYPFLSVMVQEFVYRPLFFHRYGPLFGSRRRLAIVVSAALFALGHVIFRNWVAVAGTFLTGLLFAWRYERTRSFWAVWLEHTLWGWAVFTIGLGGFFFTGVVTGWKLPL